MSSFAVSEFAALFRKSERMVSRQNILPKLNDIVVMSFSHVSKALVCSILIVLHIHIPSICEFNKLSSLNFFNLLELLTLPILHLPDVSFELDLGEFLEPHLRLLRFKISLFLFELSMVVCEDFQEENYLEIRQTINAGFGKHLSVFNGQGDGIAVAGLFQMV